MKHSRSWAFFGPQAPGPPPPPQTPRHCVNIHQCITMAEISVREQKDMIFTYIHTYGCPNVHVSDAALLCKENFPDQKQPTNQTVLQCMADWHKT